MARVFAEKIIVKMAKAQCHNCEAKCGKGRIRLEVAQKLEQDFQRLMISNSNSLLKLYLTPSVFDSLKVRKTSFGSTLLDCIQSGKKK